MRRTKHCNAPGAQSIANTSDQRCLGPDHNKVNGVLFGECRDVGGGVWVEARKGLGVFGDAAVAAGHVRASGTRADLRELLPLMRFN